MVREKSKRRTASPAPSAGGRVGRHAVLCAHPPVAPVSRNPKQAPAEKPCWGPCAGCRQPCISGHDSVWMWIITNYNVCVCVEDEGGGAPPLHHPQLCNPYPQCTRICKRHTTDHTTLTHQVTHSSGFDLGWGRDGDGLRWAVVRKWMGQGKKWSCKGLIVSAIEITMR